MRISDTRTLTDRIRALPAQIQGFEDRVFDLIAGNPLAAALLAAAALAGLTAGWAAVHLLFPALIAAGLGA